MPWRPDDSDARTLEHLDRVPPPPGPLILKDLGFHQEADEEWYIDDLAPTDEDLVEPAILVDEDGRAWEIVGRDEDMVQALVAEYDQSRSEAFGDGMGAFAEAEEFPEIYEAAFSWLWSEYSCGSNTKSVYNFGTQSDLTSLTNQERGSIGYRLFSQVRASFVVVGEDLVLTAGHNPTPTVGSGTQICVETATNMECRFVTSFVTNGTSNCSNDWKLVRVDAPFTLPPQPFDLASGGDTHLQQQVPRAAGFPVIRMGQESTCGGSMPNEGERNAGSYQEINSRHLRLSVTAGSGMSGGPYHFWNATQQRYKVMGVHSRRGMNSGARYACGPKVPYWRSDIIAAGAALGGTF